MEGKVSMGNFTIISDEIGNYTQGQSLFISGIIALIFLLLGWILMALVVYKHDKRILTDIEQRIEHRIHNWFKKKRKA